MHHIFEIKTDAFQGVAPRPDAINELIGGDEMAEWLCEQLDADGMSSDIMGPEDYGWEASVVFENRYYRIICACDFDELSSPADQHIVQLVYNRSLMDKLFGRNKLPEPDPVLSKLRGLLTAHPDFTILHDQPAR